MNDIVNVTMNTDEYIDEDGNKIEPYSCEILYDDYTAVVTPMTMEEKERFDILLQKSTQNIVVDYDLIDVVTQEAQDYFNKNADLETVVKNIQNKAKTYLDERK